MDKRHGDLKHIDLNIPVSPQVLARIEPGNVVYLNGPIYTAREGVFRKVIEEGVPLPDGLAHASNATFHCSPAAARQPDGTYNVGGVTATASFRFSHWMQRWFDVSGAKMIIGKGGMKSTDYRDYFVPAGAVYLTTVGYGTGALLGRGIKRVRDVYWLDELGIAQALWVFEVERFGPFLVESDLQGNSLFEEQSRLVNENIKRIYTGLRPPALRRFGETDDRQEDLI